MKIFMQDQRGLTLVEVLIGLTITVLVAGAVFGMASAARRSYQHSSGQNYNILAAKKALSQIGDELRYAKAITDPAESATDSSASFTVGTQTRQIYLGTGAAANTIFIKRGSATPVTLAPGMVQSMTFTRSSTDSQLITVALKVQDTSTAADKPVMNVSTAIRMPNL